MSIERRERREFRRAAIWLATLILIVVLGDHAIAFGLDRVVERSGLRFSRVYRGGLPPGVLVLGDSRGVDAIYPPIASPALSMPVFNLSYTAQSTRIQEALLRDYLDHNAAPKLVLIEVTSLEESDGLLSELKLYSGLSARIAALYQSLHPGASAATRFAHLYRYDSEMFLRCLYYLRRSDQIWGNSYTIAPRLLEATATEPGWNIDPREENLAALARMTALLRDRGIAIRLFIAPYLPQHAAHLQNLAAFAALVEARAGGGLRVWSFADAVRDPAAFGDRIHVNTHGAASLLDYMRLNGFFDPARPNPPTPANG